MLSFRENVSFDLKRLVNTCAPCARCADAADPGPQTSAARDVETTAEGQRGIEGEDGNKLRWLGIHLDSPGSAHRLTIDQKVKVA